MDNHVYMTGEEDWGEPTDRGTCKHCQQGIHLDSEGTWVHALGAHRIECGGGANRAEPWELYMHGRWND